MKSIAKFEQSVGGDGAKVSGQVGVENKDLKIEIAATYPIEKIVSPATKALDSALDKLEKAIPGDWDKPLIAKIKEDYKTELVNLLAE